MLGEDGRLKGDLTLFNWGDGTWWLMGSYYLRAAGTCAGSRDHMEEGVTLRDLGEEMAGFSLAGPRSAFGDRKTDRRADKRPAFHGLRALRHRPFALPCWPGSRSAGEAGFEISCRMGDHSRFAADPDGGGRRRRDPRIRLQRASKPTPWRKSFGIWSREFTQGYTPGMTGHGPLDRLGQRRFYRSRLGRDFPSAMAMAGPQTAYW